MVEMKPPIMLSILIRRRKRLSLVFVYGCRAAGGLSELFSYKSTENDGDNRSIKCVSVDVSLDVRLARIHFIGLQPAEFRHPNLC